jgi:OmpA-OmpF porin, OOP family
MRTNVSSTLVSNASRTKRCSLALVGMTAVLPPASALSADQAESSFRLGLGAGRASIELEDADADDTTVGLELFLGYELNEYVAIEGGYLYGGEVEEESVAVLGNTGGPYVSVLGSYPIEEDMSAYVRVGWLDWNADRKDADILDDTSADDNGALFGVGFGVLVEDALVRIEYRMADLDDTDLNFVSLALAWRFGTSR